MTQRRKRRRKRSHHRKRGHGWLVLVPACILLFLAGNWHAPYLMIAAFCSVPAALYVWLLTRRTRPRRRPVTRPLPFSRIAFGPPAREIPPGQPGHVSRSIPQDVKIYVSARDGGRCVYRDCGRGPCSPDLQFGHVIPYSRGGQPTRENIQLECGLHNQSKGTRVWPRPRRARLQET